MKQNPHGGDVRTVAAALKIPSYPELRLDFSVNVNPMGPPPEVRQVLINGLSDVMRYPDATAERSATALAKTHDVPRESVLVGNGSTEIFGWILQALRPQRVSLIAPCYAGYEETCLAFGVNAVTDFTASPMTNFAVGNEAIDKVRGDIVFIGTPNNPTGQLISPIILREAANRHPQRFFVIDESFMDFVPHARKQTLISRDLPGNMIVVKSMTKFFAIPGLRLGMACAHPDIIQRIDSVRLPWSVNALAQNLALKLYDNQEYIETSRQRTAALRDRFIRLLSVLPGLTVYDSKANFLLVRLPDHWQAPYLQAELLKQGILIRSCENFKGLGPAFCRLAIRPESEMDEFLAAISALVDSSRPRVSRKKKRRVTSIMVVGTTSNAGKSVVAAALCRHFSRKGCKVAPFKAQNMSLNSFVTAEGGEMGRAQVVQARAAGVKPHTDMNPVLLKPLGETGSQVIVNGKSIGNFPAMEYYAMKARMRAAACKAYDRLAARYDLIILEGAGSPVEINLQAEDFVNMSMAEYADASVILVADIDRGGVFASIYGTISLLPDKHRCLLSGIIINKFRGDKSLLDAGIRQIEKITGVPVLGVLPYVRDLRIEDEDSLGLENRQIEQNPILDIVVIRLPRISNFTDFLPLENSHGVLVRYVADASDLGKPDLVIIPGTKNTRADLRFLHDCGWTDSIRQAEQNKTPIFGICGGFQMLGHCVSDPSGVEGDAGEEVGLGFLPMETVLEPRKELAQVLGKIATDLPFVKAGTTFKGYEIHAGQTTLNKSITAPLTITQRNSTPASEPVGAVSDNGLVFGCYIHGLFDEKPLRKQLLDWLCERKGVAPLKLDSTDNASLNEFDRIADLLETHLDMKRIEALFRKTE